jgi:hypothetical protein
MSERLTDLQRQRALAQEQLAWLDREITRELAASGRPAITPPAAKPAQVSSPTTTSRATAGPDPEELIRKFKDEGRTVHGEVKRGCLIYFFSAFALLVLGVLALYYFRQR